MPTVRIKRHDTRPFVDAVILDELGQPVELSEATATFIMANSQGQMVFEKAASVHPDQVNHRGEVSYRWEAEDTAWVGTYRAEFEVTFSDGSTQSFPTKGHIWIKIHGDLENDISPSMGEGGEWVGGGGGGGATGPVGPPGPPGPAGPAGTLPPTLALPAATGRVTEITVVDDGSATSGWPDRWQWMFDSVGGPSIPVAWNNEYGEMRGAPAKANTVPFRLFTKDSDTSPVHTNNMFEIQDDRTNRNIIVAIDTAGNITATNVREMVVTWPTGSEPSLAGIPDGTLWVQYTP